MIKVAIPGVNGRMGQAVAKAVLQSEDLQLVIATVRDTCEQLGAKVANSDVTITDKILNADFDVLIDFTLPTGVLEHLDYCVAHAKAMVIGATGFTEEQLEQVRNAARKIPIVMASNMSIGVNVCYKLLAQASKMLHGQHSEHGEEWEMSIIDVHHMHKKDSPSGTAKQIAKVLCEHSGKDLDEIAITSERIGDVVGTHVVTFKSPYEFITIGHEAQDRGIFAQGAITAARWVHDREPGLYSMQDVIG